MSEEEEIGFDVTPRRDEDALLIQVFAHIRCELEDPAPFCVVVELILSGFGGDQCDKLIDNPRRPVLMHVGASRITLSG